MFSSSFWLGGIWMMGVVLDSIRLSFDHEPRMRKAESDSVFRAACYADEPAPSLGMST